MTAPQRAATRPQWQLDLLRRPLWSFAEAVSVLVGTEPDDATVPSRPDAEWHRVARLVDRAVAGGELRVVEYFRATTEAFPYGACYIRRDDLVCWAATRRVTFPHFTLTRRDLPSTRIRDPRGETDWSADNLRTKPEDKTWGQT